MADEELGTGSVSIELDDAAADAGLDRLADKIERILDRAARDAGRRMERQLNQAIRRINPLKVQVTADLSDFDSALNRVNNLGSAPIKVVPEVDRDTFVAQVQAALAGASVSINVVPDLSGFDAAVRRHRPPTVTIDTRVDNDRVGKALSGAGKALGGILGKVADVTKLTTGIAALGIAAAGAAQGVGGLVAALAPAAGIIAAGPAVILGYQAALGGLKLALAGVGDAFSAALTEDAAKFEKAIADLSPAAKAAAREVRALKPAFEGLRNSIQDAFFENLTGEITKTAKALKGPLTIGLTNIGDSWGFAAKQALGYIRGAEGVRNVSSILIAAGSAVEGLGQGTNKLTAGFLRSAAVISDVFGDRFANQISSITQRFGTFLSTAAGDGRLVGWVEGAIAALSQLGTVLGNIGGILKGLFDAAATSGGGFLANLGEITGKFREFVESAQGQQAISGIFQTISTVAAQLAPILSAIVTQIGAIAPALAPLITTVGPAITAVINALGPAIAELLPGVTAVVNGIVSALGEISASGVLADIGKALSDVLVAVAPLLPVIGELVSAIGTALAPVVSTLATALAPVIKAFGEALTPILPPLVDAVLQLVDAFTPLLAIIGTSLASVIEAIAPLLLTLAQTLGTIAEAAAPLIVQLTDGLAPIIEQIAPIIGRLVEAVAPLITQLVDALLPVLPPLIDAFLAILEAITPLIDPFVQIVEALTPLVALVIQAIAPIIEFAAEVVKWLTLNGVVPIIQAIVDVLGKLITGVADVLTGITNFVEDVKTFFTDLSDSVVTTVTDFVDSVGRFFSDLWTDSSQFVSNLVDDVTGFFGDMKDRVVETLALWFIAAKDQFQQLKDGAEELVRTMVDNVVRFFTELPGKARSALSNLGSSIVQVASDAASSFTRRISQLVTDAVNALRALPGKAKGALSNLGSTLYSAGQDLIRGLINGVRNMAGSLVSAAKDVVGGAVSAAKNLLGIASPSKVFFRIGQFTGQGLINGLTSTASSIAKTSENLVKVITDAFKKLKKTSLDEFLIRQVQTTQRRLEGLAAQREAVAKRIADANEFAAQTAERALSGFELGNLELGTGPINLTDLIEQLRNAGSQVARFDKQVQDLAKRGLRKDLLDQLIEKGPEAGTALADALSRATAAQLKDLNSVQGRLDTAARKLGQTSADIMFDAGKNAAAGFLTGLKSQQKDIENLMISIAKGLQNAIRSALGIRSPSTVLRTIGENTGQGLVNGIRSMRAAVTRAALSLADSAVPSVGTPAVRAAVSPVSSLGNPFGTPVASVSREARTAAPAASQTNTFNIYEVGDGEATARRVVNRMALAAGL